MKYLLTTFAFLFLVGAVQYAAAQELGGGVDKEGSWYVGEGLKTGDRFEYSVCHVEYKECKPLVMDFWIKGDIVEGTETKWLVETVVYDGNKIIKGQMHLGKLAPEYTGGSSELRVYASVFKSSYVWQIMLRWCIHPPKIPPSALSKMGYSLQNLELFR